MTTSSLPAALRAGTGSLYALKAATGLIIAHRTRLARSDDLYGKNAATRGKGLAERSGRDPRAGDQASPWRSSAAARQRCAERARQTTARTAPGTV
jgi:hypothetical protein